MTVMLLALFFSDAALNANEASDYRLLANPLADADQPVSRRAWTPGVKGWERRSTEDCPAFFQRELEGVGVVRVGPRCADEEIPYAL
jgi:hypothetical protein